MCGGGANSPDEPQAGGGGQGWQGAMPHSHTIGIGVFISTKIRKYIAV